MSSLKSSKKKKKQQMAAALAAASAMGATDEVPERGTRSRNQAISHGGITIQADLLTELQHKKRKSSSSLSKSKGVSKSASKPAKNAPVAAILSKKSGIEVKSTSILVLAHLSGGATKRVRFELSSTIAACLKHMQKLDKELEGGLYLPAGGIWLDESRTVASYAIEEMEAVEVLPRPSEEADSLTVQVMTPQDAAFDSITVTLEHATIRGVLQSMKDKPSTFDMQSSSLFHQASGQWLDTDTRVSNYDLEKDAVLIYGERSQKKLTESGSPSASPLQGRRLDHPPLLSSMSEASLPLKSDSRPSRTMSTGRKLLRGESSESVKFSEPRVKSSSGLAEISRADSSPSSSSKDEMTAVKKACFDSSAMPVRHPSDDSSPRTADKSPVISRGRRAMSVSCDGNSRLSRDAIVQQFTREDLSSGDGDKSTVTLNVLVAHARKKIVVTTKRADTVASALEAIESELGTSEPKCCLFHPRNMTKMDETDLLSKYELKDEDILVFKPEDVAPVSEKRSSEKKHDRKSKGFFKRIRTASKTKDLPLAAAPAAPVEPGPLVLHEAIVKRFLQALTAAKAEMEQGVFRISGNSAEIKEMKENLRFVGAKIDLKDVDTHELTGCLKYYLREIEEPVVPYQFYDQILETHDGSNVDVQELKSVISKLPETHRLSLAMTIKFLTTVIVHAESNLMSADNLGIVFGPTLIRNPGDSIDLGKTGALADLVVAMIENCVDIFEEEDTQYMDVDETDDSYDETGGSSTLEVGQSRDGDATSNDKLTSTDEVQLCDSGDHQDTEDDEDDESEGSDNLKTQKAGEAGEEAVEANEGGNIARGANEVSEDNAIVGLEKADGDVEEDDERAGKEEERELKVEAVNGDSAEADCEKDSSDDQRVLGATRTITSEESSEVDIAEEEEGSQDVAEEEPSPIDSQLDAALFHITTNPSKGSALLRDLLEDRDAARHLADTRSKQDLLELLRIVASSNAQ